jgi:mono/diheme cytochrome c family protein
MSRVRIVAAMSFLLLVACGNGGSSGGSSGQSGGSQPSASTFDPAKATEAFNQRCSTCHGTDGKGSGPGAATLNPKPRDFTDKHWQSSITDQMIESTIKVGGAAVGKSPAMPAHPDLGGKPEELAALRQVIRNFGKN